MLVANSARAHAAVQRHLLDVLAAAAACRCDLGAHREKQILHGEWRPPLRHPHPVPARASTRMVRTNFETIFNQTIEPQDRVAKRSRSATSVQVAMERDLRCPSATPGPGR